MTYMPAKEHHDRGFSLVEVLVALTVLGIALAGAFALIQSSADQLNRAKLRMKATYLANEGIELIRQRRDTNQLQDERWAKGFAGNIGDTNCAVHPAGGRVGCRVSVLGSSGNFTDPPRIEMCWAGRDDCSGFSIATILNKSKQERIAIEFFQLKRTADGRYGHFDGGTDTPFYRRVTRDGRNVIPTGGRPSDRPDEYTITVEVTYEKGGRSEIVEVKETIRRLK